MILFYCLKVEGCDEKFKLFMLTSKEVLYILLHIIALSVGRPLILKDQFARWSLLWIGLTTSCFMIFFCLNKFQFKNISANDLLWSRERREFIGEKSKTCVFFLGRQRGRDLGFLLFSWSFLFFLSFFLESYFFLKQKHVFFFFLYLTFFLWLKRAFFLFS